MLPFGVKLVLAPDEALVVAAAAADDCGVDVRGQAIKGKEGRAGKVSHERARGRAQRREQRTLVVVGATQAAEVDAGGAAADVLGLSSAGGGATIDEAAAATAETMETTGEATAPTTEDATAASWDEAGLATTGFAAEGAAGAAA